MRDAAPLCESTEPHPRKTLVVAVGPTLLKAIK